MGGQLYDYLIAVFLVAVSVATLILVFKPRKCPAPTLHPSSVGPLVHHPDVYDNVRRQFEARARHEMDRRALENNHHGLSGIFGSNYAPYSSCCS